MIDPSLALFAIEAGVRLGRKINEVLIDETATAVVDAVGRLVRQRHGSGSPAFLLRESARPHQARRLLLCHPHFRDYNSIPRAFFAGITL